MKHFFSIFLTAMLSGITVLTSAQDIMVSGAGSSDVNGTYVENGTYNGKPKYEYNGYAIVWECYSECMGWHLMVDYGGWYDDPHYVTGDGGDTPPSTGWYRDWAGSDPVPSFGPAGPSLSYGSSIFREAEANDGSIASSTNDVTITHNGLDGNVFAGTNGEDFVATGKATITNLPAGLAASIIRVSSTELTFSLSGNASSHVNTDDIANLTVTFENAAFSGGVAADITNSEKNDFEINFIQVFTVASSGADFTSVSTAIAAASDYDEIQISGETFTESGLSVSKTLTFRGQGAGQTIIQASASPNSGGGLIFNISSAPDWVKFYDITIQNGDVSGGNPNASGIRSGSSLEMYRCEILNCRSNATAANQAAGLNCGGGYVILEDCLLAGNVATTSGVQMLGGAATISAYGGTIEITNCTFANNSVSCASSSSGNGAGLYCGGGSFVISNCTFTNNTASGKGGGVYTQTDVTFKNTISYGNSAASGSDFYRHIGTTNASNSIIGSTATYSGVAINGTSSNVSSSNPLLQSLADNGGKTQTIAIAAGSPAIDAGLSGETEYDQRGYFRNGTRDIGAYEYGGFGNTWFGWADSNWNNTANWADNSVPTSVEDAIITSEGNSPEISGTPASPTLVAALTIEAGATLVVGPGKALTASGNTDNEGTILIEADATGIGSFIDNGTITGSGSFLMEQYLTGAGGATPNGVFYYVSNPATGASAASYELASGNKVWSANEVSQSYTQLTNGSTVLNPTEGYVARMGTAGTITLSGTSFNTGAVSASGLTRTGTTETNRGYNLVGNPYPSTVDWDDLGRTNLETSMWYRTNNAGTMTFDTYNATGMVGTNNNGGGAVDGTIPPTQAFWVRVDADGNTGQLDFENADRSHGTLASIYKTEAQEGLVRMTLSNGTISDEAIVMFDANAQDNFDNYDSHKYWAANIPQLYMNELEDTLAINGLYSTTTNPVVDLGMKLPTAGNYSLNANSITLVGETVHLEDRLLNIFQDLNMEPNYSFTADAGNVGDRFALHFGMMTVGINDEVSINSRVYTSNQNQLNIILANNIENGNVEVLDMSGRIVHSSNLNASRSTVAINTASGVYLIRVKTEKGTDTHRILFN